MTQEKANKIFQSELGQQLNEIFVTSDDRAFIRQEEAVEHAHEKQLENKAFTIWYPEYNAVAWDADNGQACSFEKKVNDELESLVMQQWIMMMDAVFVLGVAIGFVMGLTKNNFWLVIILCVSQIVVYGYLQIILSRNKIKKP